VISATLTFVSLGGKRRPWILLTSEAGFGGYYVRFLRGASPEAAWLGGCSAGPEAKALGKKHLPSVILLFEPAPGTDKAQFELRKYRNESCKVAIDQAGNFDYKMG
jgi:hypothetical protein